MGIQSGVQQRRVGPDDVPFYRNGLENLQCYASPVFFVHPFDEAELCIDVG